MRSCAALPPPATPTQQLLANTTQVSRNRACPEDSRFLMPSLPLITLDLYPYNNKLLLASVPVLGFYDLSHCQLPGGWAEE